MGAGELLVAGGALVLAWVFVGFPVVVALGGLLLRRKPRRKNIVPRVSLVIAAYNEERHIARKIRNALELRYPQGKLEIIVASDGSTDGTERIVRQFTRKGVKLLALPRRGKIAALNDAVRASRGRILVFSDANTLYAPDALRKLVRNFADPRVGGVSGNQVHRFRGGEDSTGRGESVYWKYDKWLKACESATGSIVSADGAIYAIRRSLYREPPNRSVNDDFVISASVVAQGYRLVFDGDAIAWEPPAARAADEFARKVRILSRGWWSVLAVRSLLNPFRFPLYSGILFTHKVLRRLTPLFLAAIAGGGLLLAADSPVFAGLAAGQGFLVVLAGFGALLRNTRVGKMAPFSIPFFFCLANLAALTALGQFFRGKRADTWETRGREEEEPRRPVAVPAKRARPQPVESLPVRPQPRGDRLRRALWFAGIVVVAFVLGVVSDRFGLLLPMLGAVAAAAVAGLFFFPQIGTVLFIALAYANIPVLAGRAVGNPWVVGGLASALVALPAFVQIYVLKRGWVVDRTLLMMLAFLGTLFLSSLVARDHGIAMGWIATFGVEGLLLYVLLVNAVRRLELLRAVVWTLVIVSTVLTTLGMYQEVTHNYTNDFGGLAQRKLTRWDENEVRETGLVRERTKVSAADRIGGPVNDPNHFAQLLIVVLPLAFALIYAEKRILSRILAVGTTAVLLGGIMLTYSRGAFLVLVALIPSLAFLGYLRWRHLAIGVVLVVALTAVVAPGYFDRMDSIKRITNVTSDAGDWRSGDFAVRGRLTEMLAATHVFLDHPVIGVGPGQYTPFYSLEYMSLPGVVFKELDEERRAHTLYIELAAETGIVGLAVFLTIAGLVLLRLWRVREKWLDSRPEYAHLATGIALALVAYLGTAAFLSLAFQRYYWMIVALAGAAVQVLGTPRLDVAVRRAAR